MERLANLTKQPPDFRPHGAKTDDLRVDSTPRESDARNATGNGALSTTWIRIGAETVAFQAATTWPVRVSAPFQLGEDMEDPCWGDEPEIDNLVAVSVDENPDVPPADAMSGPEWLALGMANWLGNGHVDTI